jgi:hypothetical protein
MKDPYYRQTCLSKFVLMLTKSAKCRKVIANVAYSSASFPPEVPCHPLNSHGGGFHSMILI